MEQINIQTTQNVFLRHRIASVGERILAALIDGVIFVIYYMAVAAIASKVLNNDYVLIVIVLSPILLYDLLCEIFLDGQSFGKKILKIKVVKIDGSQPSIFNYLIRWLFRIIEYAPIAMVIIIINGKGQRLGDIAAKTCVISLKDKADLKNTIYVDVPQNYQVKYEQVNLLSETDIKTIFEVLTHYRKNVSNANTATIVHHTARMVEEKTGIVNDTNPAQFLNRIIYDYNFLNKKKI